jgi:hypothetical protein
MFGAEEADYVGHRITQSGITHNRERIDKVLSIEKSTHQKQLKSFIGVAEYFHDHVRNFSDLLSPLRKLMQPYNTYHKTKWTHEASIALKQ